MARQITLVNYLKKFLKIFPGDNLLPDDDDDGDVGLVAAAGFCSTTAGTGDVCAGGVVTGCGGNAGLGGTCGDCDRTSPFSRGVTLTGLGRIGN